jgi:RNA-binding protein
VKKTNFSFLVSLSSEQRAKLKSMAHHLKPVVKMGHQGLSVPVQQEILLALDKHELIKIQLPGDNDADSKQEMQEELKAFLPAHSHIVSRIGRTVILYLEKEPKERKVKL